MEVYTVRMAIESFLMYPGSQDGRLSDDHSWSKQDIYNKLLEHRSVVVMAALSERGEVSDAMRQTIPCLAMKRIDRVECPAAPPSGCYWSRSVHPVPTPIMLTGVGDVRGDHNFIASDWKKIARVAKARIRSKRSQPHYFLKENGGGYSHLYVTVPEPAGKSDLTSVPAFTISGIFHNPLDVLTYAGACSGEVDTTAYCNPLDTPFYTDLNLRPQIFGNTWNTLLTVRQGAPIDTLNNDTFDRVEQRKKAQ